MGTRAHGQRDSHAHLRGDGDRDSLLADTPSDTYDAILKDAIERYDDVPINDTAVDELIRLAGPLDCQLNLDVLRTGTLLDGAILFAELVDRLDHERAGARDAAGHRPR